MSNYIKYKNQYYILAGSSLADDRTMVLKDGESFGVFDRFGDIHPIGLGAQGLFHEGTRYLSRMELLIDGKRPLFLSSGLKEENELLTADLSNPDLHKVDEIILERGSLHIHRTKFMYNKVMYETIRLCNFSTDEIEFNLDITFEADYKDIFEIRGISRKESGKRMKNKIRGNEFFMSYTGLDSIKRTTHIKLDPEPTLIKGTTVSYKIKMCPKACDYITTSIAFEADNEQAPLILDYDEAYFHLLKKLEKLKREVCDIVTSNDQFNEWLFRSKSDLATMISETEHGLYPYAGIPWYSTAFGRDGIFTAWECLWLNPELTRGVLKYLAKTQACEQNDFQDAEPGKIFHEKRGGEMAELGEIPFKLYYGTIDATPLFICLAGAYFERTGDIKTIKDIWPNIERALEWIDQYGDIDGDGYVEYAKKSDKGLINQGWKDSHDSVFHENGELAKAPIALSEVQGYVYDAKVKAAELAKILGYEELASKLCKEAEDLKGRFNSDFWSKDKKTYVIALDGENNQCNVNSSNAGHCLFSGIATEDKAEKIAAALLDDKMFSGWGVRTIAIDEALYNPMSYHNGSIWPHDNAIIAYGLSQYGYKDEVKKIMEGMFEASTFVEAQRLPELFCGFEKRKNEGPTAYPVACSPQAWAVASVYMFLQACLGIKIVSEDNTIYFFDPTLPDFLDEVTISNLKVNDASVVLQVRRLLGECQIQILHKEGNIKIEVVKGSLPLYKKIAPEKVYK